MARRERERAFHSFLTIYPREIYERMKLFSGRGEEEGKKEGGRLLKVAPEGGEVVVAFDGFGNELYLWRHEEDSLRGLEFLEVG